MSGFPANCMRKPVCQSICILWMKLACKLSGLIRCASALVESLTSSLSMACLLPASGTLRRTRKPDGVLLAFLPTKLLLWLKMDNTCCWPESAIELFGLRDIQTGKSVYLGRAMVFFWPLIMFCLALRPTLASIPNMIVPIHYRIILHHWQK